MEHAFLIDNYVLVLERKKIKFKKERKKFLTNPIGTTKFLPKRFLAVTVGMDVLAQLPSFSPILSRFLGKTQISYPDLFETLLLSTGDPVRTMN